MENDTHDITHIGTLTLAHSHTLTYLCKCLERSDTWSMMMMLWKCRLMMLCTLASLPPSLFLSDCRFLAFPYIISQFVESFTIRFHFHFHFHLPQYYAHVHINVYLMSICVPFCRVQHRLDIMLFNRFPHGNTMYWKAERHDTHTRLRTFLRLKVCWYTWKITTEKHVL